MSRLLRILALLSVAMVLSAPAAWAQNLPKPPPFRPKPPPFNPKPPPVQPVPPGVAPVQPVVPKPDDEQRRRRLFFLLMLRQQALTRAALQQAALASAFANQAPLQAAAPSYSIYNSPPSYSPPPAPAVREQQPPAAELTLLAGIVGADGKVAWPLGLQIARPALETKTLRERIDGLVRMAAKQTAHGQVQPGILDEAKQYLAELRTAFERSRQDMPERTGQDAEAFLARLDSSLQAMQGSGRAAPSDGSGKKKY